MHCAQINAPPDHPVQTLLTFVLGTGGASDSDGRQGPGDQPNTLQAVSKATQLSERTLRRWIRGEVTPRPGALQALWLWIAAAMRPVYIMEQSEDYTLWLLVRDVSWCAVVVAHDSLPVAALSGTWPPLMSLAHVVEFARANPVLFTRPISQGGV